MIYIYSIEWLRLIVFYSKESKSPVFLSEAIHLTEFTVLPNTHFPDSNKFDKVNNCTEKM